MDRDWASGRARSAGRDAASDLATPGKQTGTASSEMRAAAGPMPYPNASPLGDYADREGGDLHRTDHPQPHAGGRPHAARDGGITHETFATQPADRNRTTVGVGEKVTFRAPRPGTWTASASTLTPTAIGPSYDWRAPDVAGPVTITHQAEADAQRSSVTMTVVAPTAVHFQKITDEPQSPAGVGMWTRLTFDPVGVSWNGAEWAEKGNEAFGRPQGATGYFEEYLRTPGQRPLIHEPASWLSMSAEGDGLMDHAYMSGKPQLGRPPRYYDGSFFWSIPNVYRVPGLTTEHPIATVTQTFTMLGGANTGGMTVAKGSAGGTASATQMPSGQMVGATPDTTDRLETVDAARTWLEHRGNTAQAVTAGLQRVSNYRANDRVSFENLVAALRELDHVSLYVSIRCANSYTWVPLTEDHVEVEVSCHGHTRNWAFDTNSQTARHGTRHNVPWLELIDPATFNLNDPITFRVTAEGHTFTAQMTYPFHSLNSADFVPLEGSDGRYAINTYLDI